MRKIHRLESLVISQISAGEVIDRPASIVKELIENALDSGATRIHIHIQDGGKTRIQVTDNGSGIDPEDLPLAPLRHATSKLQKWEDIYSVSSFGFRGEALASMAQSGRLTLTSRTEEHPIGYEIKAHSDQIGDLQPVAHPVGTTVVLDALFAEMPVRLKFLKSATTEASSVMDILLHHALISPQVAFILTQDGKEKFNSTGIHDPIELAVHLLGKSAKNHLIPIQMTRQEIQIKGVIGDPGLTYPNRNKQWIAINGRPVKNSLFQKALYALFSPRVPHGRFGFAILDIHLPRQDVDINSHPQKLEFQLSQAGWAYTQVQSMLATVFSQARNHALDPSTFRSLSGAEPWTYTPPDSRYLSGVEEPLLLWQPLTEQSNFPQESRPLSGVEGLSYFQVFDTYLIVNTPQGVVMLDQHAVHERILYERITLAAKSPGHRQPLGISEIVTLPPDLYPLLETLQDEIQALGFDITPFGGFSVRVNEIPIEWMGVPITPFLLDWLEQAKSLAHLPKMEIEDIKKERLQMMACKAAIKAGKPLSQLETETLIRDFLATPNRDTCPHGRPVAILLDKAKLERLFLRT